jgi:hypothetical protein
MKELLKYRDNSYFNETDHFLADNGLNGYYLTKLEFSKGGWSPTQHTAFVGGILFPSGHWQSMPRFHSVGCCQMLFTSTLSINCNELLGREVEYRGTGIKGTVTKFLLHNMGVNWHQGQGKFKRKFGLPNFWNEPKYLEFT